MKRVEPIIIREILNKFIRDDAQLAKGILEARAIESWRDVVGRSVADATTRIYIREGVIHVFINSSVLCSEVFMRRSSVAKQINERVGRFVVKGLVVRQF